MVLLRAVNVGGHKTFRPSVLARQLSHLDAVNIGAAGTFVIRKSITQAQLRSDVNRRLPVDAEVIICNGRDITRLLSEDYFGDQPSSPDVVRFVSVLARNTRRQLSLPMSFPSDGQWVLKILAREGRFLVGVYRRHMNAIGHLAALDRHFGVPVTTRNWNTMTAVVRAMDNEQGAGRRR